MDTWGAGSVQLIARYQPLQWAPGRKKQIIKEA